jgi:uncharacterized protein (DUF2062 family)
MYLQYNKYWYPVSLECQCHAIITAINNGMTLYDIDRIPIVICSVILIAMSCVPFYVIRLTWTNPGSLQSRAQETFFDPPERAELVDRRL